MEQLAEMLPWTWQPGHLLSSCLPLTSSLLLFFAFLLGCPPHLSKTPRRKLPLLPGCSAALGVFLLISGPPSPLLSLGVLGILCPLCLDLLAESFSLPSVPCAVSSPARPASWLPFPCFAFSVTLWLCESMILPSSLSVKHEGPGVWSGRLAPGAAQ